MSQPQSQDTPGFVQDDICPLARMGTWVAETIRASGQVHRANRPNTRPLLTKCRSPQKCLALQEPSTQDNAPIRCACAKVGLGVRTLAIGYAQFFKSLVANDGAVVAAQLEYDRNRLVVPVAPEPAVITCERGLEVAFAFGLTATFFISHVLTA